MVHSIPGRVKPKTLKIKNCIWCFFHKRTSCIWWDDFCFVLDHLNTLSWKFIVLDMSIFSLSLLVLHAYGRSIKYNFLFLELLANNHSLYKTSIRARCTTLCDKVCQWLATGWWFYQDSSTNKSDCHDITEIVESGGWYSWPAILQLYHGKFLLSDYY
jgi:hypothetical protein